MKPQSPINPSHETRQSGRSCSRHSRNSVYYKRTWFRIPAKGRKRPKTVVRNALDLSRPKLVEHLNIVYAAKASEPEPVVSSEPRSVRNVSVPEGFEPAYGDKPDPAVELESVMRHAFEHAVPRHRRPIATIGDFLAAYPSYRAAVIRVAAIK